MTALSCLGYSLGGEWAKVNHSLTQITHILVVVVVIAIIAFVVLRARWFRREVAAAAESARPWLPGPALGAELAELVHRDVGQAAVEDLCLAPRSTMIKLRRPPRRPPRAARPRR